MANVKLFLSAVTLAVFSSLPALAQSSASTAPQTTDSPQATPGTTQNQQTMQGNHSDPNATPADVNRAAQSGSGDGQQPTNAQPDPGMGQGTGQAAQGSSNSAAVPVQHTASSPEATNSQMRPVKAELVAKLDSKDAKAGDQVVLKTTEKATFANGVVIPKGTKITGQVVDAKAHTDANKNAQVTVQFTKAELAGGETLPIQSVLQSVGSTNAMNTATASSGAAASPSGVMGGPGVQQGTADSPVGVPAVGGTANAESAKGGAEGASGSQTAQGSTSAAAGGSVGGVSNMPVPGTVVAQRGSVQLKTTTVPGVLLETNADGKPFANASGAFVGAGHNVHLDGGTRVELAIADASGKPVNR